MQTLSFRFAHLEIFNMHRKKMLQSKGLENVVIKTHPGISLRIYLILLNIERHKNEKGKNNDQSHKSF